MRALRIVGITLATPLLAVLPYFAVLVFVVPWSGPIEASEAQGALVAGGFLLICSVLAMILLGLARLRWKTRQMIVRQHLHAWGPGLAGMLGVLVSIPCAFVSLLTAAGILGVAAVCGVIGYGATRMWERYAYP